MDGGLNTGNVNPPCDKSQRTSDGGPKVPERLKDRDDSLNSLRTSLNGSSLTDYRSHVPKPQKGSAPRDRDVFTSPF